MDFNIICPNCGTKLRLYDSQVKKKQGYIRCVRCGSRIKYDLTKPSPAATGFWPETEVPFKPGARDRFLSIARARQKNPNFQLRPLAPPPAEPAAAKAVPPLSRIPPAFDRSQSGFQAFDLKTGRIVSPGEAQDAALPASAAPKAVPARHAAAPHLAARPGAARALSPRREKPAARPAFRVPASHQVSLRAVPASGFFARIHAFFRQLFQKK